jgi:hypothetical protein
MIPVAVIGKLATSAARRLHAGPATTGRAALVIVVAAPDTLAATLPSRHIAA